MRTQWPEAPSAEEIFPLDNVMRCRIARPAAAACKRRFAAGQIEAIDWHFEQDWAA
jgi:hypothetical protein